MAVEVFMPKMSDHMEFGEIIEWLVSEGEHVEQGQVILEVTTDKAVAELEAPSSGVLKGVRPGCGPGANVPVGETMAFIAGPNEAVPVLPPLAPAGVTETEPAGRPMPPAPGAEAPRAARTSGPVRATPVARRLAKELRVDLSLVLGTGPRGRIREKDVRTFAEAAVAAPAPVVADDVEWQRLTPVQRITGRRMLDSVQSAPQFSLTIDVDATDLLRVRDGLMDRVVAKTGARPSITAILVRIVAETLKHHPRVNASYQDGRIKVHRRINVGVAVGGKDGLVVPVIRDGDRKSLTESTRELRAFQEKAREMRFSPEELSGGTFTITNLGMAGVDRFSAIINPPESAILAVGRIVNKPVGLPDGDVALRPMMSLTLTIDHRVLDGLQAAQFLAELREHVEKSHFLL